MRKETAAGWLTAILTCVLLTGCGSQAAGAARTAAAIERQAGSTEEIADHSEEKAEKPRVVLQQEEMGKETERSESEAGTEPEPETDTRRRQQSPERRGSSLRVISCLTPTMRSWHRF